MQDFTDQAIIYALLLVPTLFAFTLVAQGMNKVSHQDKSGGAGIVFGVVFFILIVVSYVFFIR